MKLIVCLTAANAILISNIHAFLCPQQSQQRRFASNSHSSSLFLHNHQHPTNDGQSNHDHNEMTQLPSSASSRRRFLIQTASIVAVTAGGMTTAVADEGMDVNDFLKTGQVAMPMGVSGQAGKSRPETGVVFRDGSEVSRDSRSGNVLAEILLQAQSDNPSAVLATFSSPWPLAKGTVFDVECRDAKTGDGAFLAVTGTTNGKSLQDLPSSFFLDKLFASTGRFSFYGSPTDIKIRKSYIDGPNRFIELSFSNLSQSTQTEIPRNAIVVATIPQGTDQAVMLVGSATANRWRKGSEVLVRNTVDTFRAVPAPKSSMKIRAKERSNTNA